MSEKNKYRVRLVRWGDSSSSGRTVTFKLPDDGDEHPFKGLDVGAKNGQLLEMEIAIFDGDGEVETLETSQKPRAKVKQRLPVVNEAPLESASGRRRATVENVTRRVIRNGNAPTVENSPAAPDTAAAAASSILPETKATEPNPSTPDTTATASTYSESQSIADVGETAMSSSPLSSPFDRPFPGSGHGGGWDTGGGSLDSADLDSYANQMGQAAEALAAVAERLEDHADDDEPQFPAIPTDADADLDPGVRAVRRATDLCKAIDKQRAGFYYFMRSRYPQAPKLAPESGEWSRDAKSTRDRVCLHCEAENLARLAQDPDARRKFEELENEFERHERLR